MASTTIEAFERQLKHKIQFKAASRVSVDAVLFKAFKFFDLYNNGWLSRTDFFKAIAKCGVVVDTHDLNAIYNHYDPENSGKIDYRNFIENLLFKDQSENESEHMNKSHYSKMHESPKVKEDPHSHSGHNDKNSEIGSNISPSEKLRSPIHNNFMVEQLSNIEEIIGAIKDNLRRQPIIGLLLFANKLKGTDVEHIHLISPQNLSANLPYLPANSIPILIDRYNPNKFGQINYAELIYNIKGNLNFERQGLVDNLFNMLDRQQKGQIEINNLISGFTNRSDLASFKRSIDLYCKFQSIDDGIFTDEDFNDFFQFVSFTFDPDRSFENFIKSGFYNQDCNRSVASSRSSRREFDPRRQASQASSHHEAVGDFKKHKINQPFKEDHINEPRINEQIQTFSESHTSRSRKSEIKSTIEASHIKQVNMMLLRIRRTLAAKGTRGFLHFEKVLKSNDINNNGLLNLDQFRSVIKEQKIDITNVEATNLFGIFDSNKTGQIDYLEFLQTLKGEIPEYRRIIIDRIWEKMKVDEQHTNFYHIKTHLNFRHHPDIETGRKYDDQVWQELIDTIMMIQDLNEIPRSDNVQKDVFIEYCENLSLSISQDSLFETMAQNFWKIGSVMNIQEQYAGSRKVFNPGVKGYLQDHHKYAIYGGTVSQNAPFGTFTDPVSYSTEHRRL